MCSQIMPGETAEILRGKINLYLAVFSAFALIRYLIERTSLIKGSRDLCG